MTPQGTVCYNSTFSQFELNSRSFFTFFHASGDFCHLLITFAISGPTEPDLDTMYMYELCDAQYFR